MSVAVRGSAHVAVDLLGERDVFAAPSRMPSGLVIRAARRAVRDG